VRDESLSVKKTVSFLEFTHYLKITVTSSLNLSPWRTTLLILALPLETNKTVHGMIPHLLLANLHLISFKIFSCKIAPRNEPSLVCTYE
jgi:hypothetical protein